IPGVRQNPEALCQFNMGLFLLFAVFYAMRWGLYFDEARRVYGHSTVSMYFGTIPMRLATIINGFLLYGLPPSGNAVIS
ncbi:C4-dicarboxylate ABC transporter, partial [Pseudomonas sp. RTS4]|nr:C4-dicarboxylate ABC transporter [Pseudomonas sp. RTS4]